MSVWSLTYQQSVFQRYHSDKHFSEILPTRWRQKATGVDMEQNYVTLSYVYWTWVTKGQHSTQATLLSTIASFYFRVSRALNFSGSATTTVESSTWWAWSRRNATVCRLTTARSSTLFTPSANRSSTTFRSVSTTLHASHLSGRCVF